MKKCSWLTSFLITAVLAPIAVAAPPQITQINPLAMAPGQTIEIRLSGKNLQDPKSLWTTFANRCEFVAVDDDVTKKGEKLTCRLTAARGEQIGIGAVRVVTSQGVSNPLLMMVDDLKSVADAGGNFTIEQAQEINWPVAIDGQCDALQQDHYKLQVAAGEQLSFEVVSQRLGSKLDPVLRLLKADGTELVRSDDAQGTGGDSRFSHTFEVAGEYLLAIGDVRHQGGADHRYRLRIGKFPLVTNVYPAGGKSGSVASFELINNAQADATQVNVAMPSHLATSGLVSFSVPAAAGSGWFQVDSNPGQEFLEQEPNNELAVATVVQVPSVLNGRLDQPGDADHFRFSAKAGQRLRLVAKSREFGSPCDLFMSLHKADGARIALAAQGRRATINVQILADGEYVLKIEDLISGGSPAHVYRVDVQETFFGFSLNAELVQYNSPQAGTFVVKVLAQRSGHKGPIELAVEGLGEGVKLEGNKLEAAETLLKITLPAGLPTGAMRLMKIVGKVTVDEKSYTVTAKQSTPLVTLFPNTLSLPTELENTVAVGVGPAFAPFFDLAVANKQVYFPQIVGTSTYDVEVKRTTAAFKEDVAFAVEGLPEGITAEVAAVDDTKKSYRVTLKGPVDFAAGAHPIKIIGTGKFKEQTRVVALADLTLQVIQPLVATVTVAGPLVAGGEQVAKVQLQRFGTEPQPVRIQIKDGPQGISAPIITQIAADASEAEIRLIAAADAPAGKFANLIVVASTAVQGQNISVESKPAAIELQAKPAAPAPPAKPEPPAAPAPPATPESGEVS
jgi:hypothetical protein